LFVVDVMNIAQVEKPPNRLMNSTDHGMKEMKKKMIFCRFSIGLLCRKVSQFWNIFRSQQRFELLEANRTFLFIGG
jgi:hypothetical protein